MKKYITTHMVRMEHLNHHGNLYAGQGIEWMVEAAFIAVNCTYGDSHGVLYKNTHKFDFYKPVKPGDVCRYEGLIVRTGRTSLTVRVGLYNEMTDECHAEGFLTFVTIDPETKRPVKHGLVLDSPAELDESKWRDEANSFFIDK